MKIAQKYFGFTTKLSPRVTHELSLKNELMVITEHFVMLWIKRRLREDASVDGPKIREEAKRIYERVCLKRKVTNPPVFDASRGWLHRFKKRYQVRYAVYQGEVASADTAAADAFPAIAKEIVDEGGYHIDQIFNCDDTAVHWKRPAKATYIPKGTKQAPGMKLAKDRFTALLTVNTSGDYKMKLVIVYKAA